MILHQFIRGLGIKKYFSLVKSKPDLDFMFQLLYHAVSVVGTLLLQIGEVGQKFGNQQQQQQTCDKFNNCDTTKSLSTAPCLQPDQSGDEAKSSNGEIEKSASSVVKITDEKRNEDAWNWSISFEQEHKPHLSV